jgi:BlaI family transcriptional regulator, penicillinase repressor
MTPRISDTEWEIMRVVWTKHPLTANEIITHLVAGDPSWHPKTARTLLARLVDKKALGFQASGREYVYAPLVSEPECLTAASESFLARCFGGSLKPMLAHFVGQQRLTKKEVEELRNLLNEAAEGKSKSRSKPWKQ